MADYAYGRKPGGDRRSAVGRDPDATPEGVEALQRRAGNRAVSSLLQRVSAAATAHDAPLLAPSDPAERQADGVAATATGRAPAGATSGKPAIVDGDVAASLTRRESGRPLDPMLARSLAPQLGAAVARVRVHDDATSHAANAAVGARALTRGSDVHLGAGESSAPDAASLLAHEATHATQDNGPAIAAKLKGSAQAVTALGGAPKKSGRSEYKKVVGLLGQYEQLEDGAVELQLQASFGYTAMGSMLVTRLDQMQTMLGELERRVVAWLGSKEAKRSGKSDRADALRLLLPRIRLEKRDLAAGNFGGTKGYDDSKVTHAEKGEAGMVNETSKVTYGAEKTYFKADEARDQMKQPDPTEPAVRAVSQHEELGFGEIDPRLGSRSVAMYRLDQVLGTGLIARTEFGTFGSKMGIVMEKAKGKTIPDHDQDGKVALTAGDAKAGQFSFEDPGMQRCLARLQVIDAIAGQLDRHAGNYFVQTDDAGKVVGVTGIDNDMAFGKNMTSVGRGKATKSAYDNYQGMPQVLDREFADVVRNPQLPALIEDAIGALLSPDELAATLARLQDVVKIVNSLDASGLIVDDYTRATAVQSRVEQYGEGSIASREQQGPLGTYLGRVRNDDFVNKHVPDVMNRNALVDVVAGYFADGRIETGEQLVAFGMALAKSLSAQEVALGYKDFEKVCARRARRVARRFQPAMAG